MSSQMNSSVYVAVRVLAPLRHTKVLPWSGDCRGILSEGYAARKASRDMTLAFPLIEARGLESHEGVMYSSF